LLIFRLEYRVSSVSVFDGADRHSCVSSLS
jgi:hypothetical protein